LQVLGRDARQLRRDLIPSSPMPASAFGANQSATFSDSRFKGAYAWARQPWQRSRLAQTPPYPLANHPVPRALSTIL
jgi:hypothetical protein